MKIRTIFPTLLGLLVLAGPSEANNPDEVAERVRGLIQATNAQDVDSILAATTEDFRWMMVKGDRVEVEVDGRNDLESWLHAYYGATPGARSEIGEVLVDGSYATTIETMHWSTPEGDARTQSATSVYHVDDEGLIRAVWYFPAQGQGQAATPGEG